MHDYNRFTTANRFAVSTNNKKQFNATFRRLEIFHTMSELFPSSIIQTLLTHYTLKLSYRPSSKFPPINVPHNVAEMLITRQRTDKAASIYLFLMFCLFPCCAYSFQMKSDFCTKMFPLKTCRVRLSYSLVVI